MGRVFRGHDTGLGPLCRGQSPPSRAGRRRSVVARFRNEAQSAARLDHENIVQVYHVGEEDGLPYIVFEFVEGVNIRALVEQKGPLPLAEAVSYTFQVARALAHAAASRVVHRDIKPSNVLVTQGRPREADRHGPGPGAETAPTRPGDLTASGVTLGTFDYISPGAGPRPPHRRRPQRHLFAWAARCSSC